MSANNIQIGGEHYKTKTIQPWDFIISNNIGFIEGNIIKYVARWKDKNGLEDLKKARHYLDKLIEVNTERQKPGIDNLYKARDGFDKLIEEKTQADNNITADDNDGWINWSGGEQPVDGDTIVDVICRGGSKCHEIARLFAWGHLCCEFDIIKYRVVK